MKVHDLNLTGAAAPESQRTNPAGDTPGREGGVRSHTEQTGDRVEFSAGLGSLTSAISSFRSDRAARVQELTMQYSTGEYRPDALATSRSMLAEALQAGTD
jgi:hypothetical protein